MTRRPTLPALFAAACALLMPLFALVGTAAAQSADPLDGSAILVAKRQLQDRVYGATLLITRPIGGERHVGFILNKPTQVTLAKLFPKHEPSRKVAEPVYLGGPIGPEVIFALVQGRESPGGRSIRILEDLYLAIDSHIVDQVIEKQAAQARFFAGMVLWKPGELAEEIKRGMWYALDARAELVLRRSTEGMWEELLGRAERRANAI